MHGELGVVVRRVGARSCLDQVYERGPLRARFPRLGRGERLECVCLNTGGGIAGGDRLAVAVEAGDGAAVSVTSQAAEKVYRSDGPVARVALRLVARRGAGLSWLPQETILFDGARLSRRLDAEVSGNARLLVCEAVVFGRSAMGERVAAGTFADRWHVRRDGRLVFADALALDGAIDAVLARPAVAAGASAIGTLLLAAGDAEPRLAAVRTALERAEVEGGASAFDGLLVARLLAGDGFELRRAVLAVLAALDVRPPHAFLL
jgi:urease accessory protein